MKTRRAGYSLLCTFLLTYPAAGGLAAADDAASGVLNETTLARAAIEDVHKINRALIDNLEAQEQAWPTREADQAKEMAAPEEVKKLQVTQIKLERQRERRLRELQKLCKNDVTPILTALRQTKSEEFLDAVVPVAVSVGRSDPRLFDVLKELEQRFDACPPSVVNGLAELGREEASLSLLESGMKERSLSILRAAGKGGDPVVLAQLMTAAESDDKELARVCIDTITRLTPPPRPTASLVGLLVQRIPEVRSPELQSSLIVYLGLCKSEESLVPLTRVFEEKKDVRVQAAVIGALGNLGTEAACRFVLETLKQKSLARDLETSCVHALGGARHRPAVPQLIRLMDDAVLNRAAARALERISGQDFGLNKGAWLRWWRSQPEARGFKDQDE